MISVLGEKQLLILFFSLQSAVGSTLAVQQWKMLDPPLSGSSVAQHSLCDWRPAVRTGMRWQMAAMTGLMISLDCLISHVGAGSNRHCFAGDFKRNLAISSVVTGWKSDSSSLTTRSPILGDMRTLIFQFNFCHKVLWKIVSGQTIWSVSTWLHQVRQLWQQCPGVATTGVNSRCPIVSKFSLERKIIISGTERRNALWLASW